LIALKSVTPVELWQKVFSWRGT